MDDNNET